MGKEYLINDKIAAEILRQNWENARYHESGRWKYTYYYYAALGAFFIYFFKTYENHGFNILNFRLEELILYGIIFFILALIGYASFNNHLYSNMEYKNHIRAIEFMARDLGVNTNISEYRDGYKEISRSSYMALPLMIGVRRKAPFTMLTGLAIAIALALSIFLLSIFLGKLVLSQSYLKNNHMIFPLSIPAIIIGLMVVICINEIWRDTEKKAEEELNKRDPKR